MGIVTQSRALKAQDLSWTHLGATPNTGTVFGNCVSTPSQTTTSFRSQSDVDSRDDESESLDRVQTSGQTFKALKEDYDADHSSGGFDTGHEFSTTRTGFTVSHKRITKGPYTGPLILNPSSNASFGFSTYPPQVDRIDTSIYGPRAIQATAPTKPQANLAVAAAELYREGIPHLLALKKVRSGIKPVDLANDWLAVNFGIIPTLSDLKQLCLSVMHMHSSWAQYRRDSGRNVRRRYTFPEEVLTNRIVGEGYTDVINSCVPNLSDTSFYRLWAGYRIDGPKTESYVVTRRSWFSGAYTYYLPQGASIPDRMARQASEIYHLLGLGLTPDVAWNLIPWSWLADWIGNIGVNMTNMSNFSTDGLVLRYGYLMSTTESKHTVTLTHGPSQGSDITGFNYGQVSNVFTRTDKMRVRATPFGFGLDTSKFSLRQWSILGALGMTHSDGRIRGIGT